MEQISNWGDLRNQGWCVYCGGAGETRDHVPSRILLDEPYPENLPVVSACRRCNLGFSLDEEYLACILECVLAGGVEPKGFSRRKIAQLMTNKPGLAKRIADARQVDGGRVWFRTETVRVRNIVVKLARGHAAFELNEPQLDEPVSVSIRPLAAMNARELEEFETVPDTHLFPEVGSRALRRIFVVGQKASGDWVEVQRGRYRYLTSQGPGMLIRMVVAEYLSCEVCWE
jgi:hypothetical protein